MNMIVLAAVVFILSGTALLISASYDGHSTHQKETIAAYERIVEFLKGTIAIQKETIAMQAESINRLDHP